MCFIINFNFSVFFPRFVKKEEERTAPSSCVYCTISKLIWEDLLDIWRKWWRNEDYFLLFWSVTGASNDMVAKQFKCWQCPYLIYFSNTNLLGESVLIWKKMCWMFFWPQDTVGTEFYFGTRIFYHTHWKKLFLLWILLRTGMQGLTMWNCSGFCHGWILCYW